MVIYFVLNYWYVDVKIDCVLKTNEKGWIWIGVSLRTKEISLMI